MKDVNLETITDTQLWCKIWPLNGFNLIHAKRNVPRKHERVYESFLSRHKSQKLFTLTIRWNLEKLVKISPGIIARLHRIDPRRMVLLMERYAAQKEGTSAVLLQPGLDEKWWLILWNAVAFLRNVQDLLADGKTPYERRSGEPSKGPIIPFGSLVEYHLFCAKDQSRVHQFGKKVFPGLFLGYTLYAGRIWKGDILVVDIDELENLDA